MLALTVGIRCGGQLWAYEYDKCVYVHTLLDVKNTRNLIPVGFNLC